MKRHIFKLAIAAILFSSISQVEAAKHPPRGTVIHRPYKKAPHKASKAKKKHGKIKKNSKKTAVRGQQSH